MFATCCAVASKWGNAYGGLWQVSFCFVASLLCCVYKSAVLPRLLVSLLQNMYVELLYAAFYTVISTLHATLREATLVKQTTGLCRAH